MFKNLFIKVIFSLAVVIWLAVLFFPDEKLHIITCDVGQGDAILVTIGSFQMLTDGGPDNSVLTCLGSHMPAWDKNIEVVILTHPQADHYTGLIEVFRRYSIGEFVASGVDNDTVGYRLLKDIVGSRGIKVKNLVAGDTLIAGRMKVTILNPFSEMAPSTSAIDKLGTFTTKQDLNDFSVSTQLEFGKFSALFTGDIGPSQITYILSREKINPVTYLKVPHHGSSNGLTFSLLSLVKPEVSVISVGRNNKFGHPHKDILDLLDQSRTKVRRTDQEETTELVTDGERYWFVNSSTN